MLLTNQNGESLDGKPRACGRFSRTPKPAGIAFVFVLVGALAGCGDDDPLGPQPQTQTCLDRAVFADAAASGYILPYPVGQAYSISQSYCYAFSGHSDQLAYDFAMPIGADVIAARSGVVRLTRDDVPDDGSGTDPTEHNDVYIEHSDGTVAFYAHLQQGSVVVEVGEVVTVGQRIAASGNSGNTGGLPHLHFGVYQDWPTREGDDLPINFRNADGPLDARGGLQRGISYEALPW